MGLCIDIEHMPVDKEDNVLWSAVSCEQEHELCCGNILYKSTEMILVDWVQG